MSGYTSDVSPVKVSKDRKRKYFNFIITDDATCGVCHRGVCFSPEKHQLFSSVAKEESNNGLEVKRFRLAPQNQDIIVTDFSSARKTELTFEKHVVMHTFSIDQIFNECALYDIVKVSVLVLKLEEEITVKKDGRT